MAEPVLVARDVWKSYDGREGVLKGASLDVGAGEGLVVQGPNGSGKTALLSILGGLLSPDRGTVAVGTGSSRLTSRTYGTDWSFATAAGTAWHNLASQGVAWKPGVACYGEDWESE